MTLKEFKKYFKVLEDMVKDNHKKQDAIAVLCPDTTAMLDSFYIDKYIDLLSFIAGDESDWVGWYVFENNMGKGGLKAGYDKVEKVDTVEKLYKVITTKI